LSTKKDLERVLLAPAAFEAVGLDTDFDALLGLQEVESYMAQDGKIVSRVVNVRSIVVFPKGHV
jgi:hypothetical protein